MRGYLLPVKPPSIGCPSVFLSPLYAGGWPAILSPPKFTNTTLSEDLAALVDALKLQSGTEAATDMSSCVLLAPGQYSSSRLRARVTRVQTHPRVSEAQGNNPDGAQSEGNPGPRSSFPSSHALQCDGNGIFRKPYLTLRRNTAGDEGRAASRHGVPPAHPHERSPPWGSPLWDPAWGYLEGHPSIPGCVPTAGSRPECQRF